jgi:hypothetical protein
VIENLQNHFIFQFNFFLFGKTLLVKETTNIEHFGWSAPLNETKFKPIIVLKKQNLQKGSIFKKLTTFDWPMIMIDRGDGI